MTERDARALAAAREDGVITPGELLAALDRPGQAGPQPTPRVLVLAANIVAGVIVIAVLAASVGAAVLAVRFAWSAMLGTVFGR